MSVLPPEQVKFQNPAYLAQAVKLTPTLKVRKKVSGRIVTITPEAFDPERHEKLDVPAAAAARVRSAPKPERVRSEDAAPRIEVSTKTEDELACMSSRALQDLPEYKHVEPDSWRTKQDLINAILQVRERAEDQD